MVRAVMMTREQIDELVALARKDAVLWEELKDREFEIEKNVAATKQILNVDVPDAVLDPPKLPTMGMMVSDLVKRQYGPDENFDRGSLTMAIRYHVRQELRLPV